MRTWIGNAVVQCNKRMTERILCDPLFGTVSGAIANRRVHVSITNIEKVSQFF